MEGTSAETARRLARTAGVLYLVNIVSGFFAIGYVPAALIVTGDASATAQHIQANEALYRASLAVHLLTTLTNIPLAVIFFEVFKVVSKRVALLVVFFTLVATAVEIVAIFEQFTVLAFLGGGYLGAFSAEQRAALAYVPLAMVATGYAVYTAFFSFYDMTIGYLVYRSRFLPRIVGVLLVLGGLAYLAASVAELLMPSFASQLFPYIGLPSLLGEAAFCVTLIAIGVNVQRWEERALVRRPA